MSEKKIVPNLQTKTNLTHQQRLKRMMEATVAKTFVDGSSILTSSFVNAAGRELVASTPRVGSDEAWLMDHVKSIAKLILEHGSPRP